MKTIIKIGQNPEKEIFQYVPKYFDNFELNMSEIDKIINKDITIVDVDVFVLCYINNLMMRFIVSKNKDIPEELKNRLNLNPKNVKIIEVDDSGIEKCIQGNFSGLIEGNYFDGFMKYIMDDFYKSINYFEEHLEKKMDLKT